MLAPVCLFTYNRLSETKKTIDALNKNYLALQTEIYIFSDAPKNISEINKIQELRFYLETINGFKKINIKKNKVNKGLADSIIDGVTEVINKHGKVIVLEDDLITTPNFLNYMNQGLEFFENKEKIISICGYGLKIKKPKNYKSDFYINGRSSSWGWATWADRWNIIDWEVKDWNSFKQNAKKQAAFNRNGSDMYGMLKSVMEEGGNSWAIRFCYHQFKNRKYSVFPFHSLVENIGFGSEGTHTKSTFSRFRIDKNLGTKIMFNFNDLSLKPNKKIINLCNEYHSISIRIYSRLRYILRI